MMVYVFVSSVRQTMPRSIVLFVPFLAFLVFGLSGFVLRDQPYMGVSQIFLMVFSVVAVICSFEIWFLLRLQYARGINILTFATSAPHMAGVAFAGCTSMLITLATLFVPFLM